MVEPPHLLQGATPLHILPQVPIMWGCRGEVDGETWSLVGTGRKVQKAINELQSPTHSLHGPTSKQWLILESIFGKDYIHFARFTLFTTYKCPNCGKHI